MIEKTTQYSLIDESDSSKNDSKNQNTFNQNIAPTHKQKLSDPQLCIITNQPGSMDDFFGFLKQQQLPPKVQFPIQNNCPNISRSIVQTLCDVSNRSNLRPWAFEPSLTESATGIVVRFGFDQKRLGVITNAHAVSNAIKDSNGFEMVNIRLSGSAYMLPLQVTAISHERDLALLTSKDFSVFAQERLSPFDIDPDYKESLKNMGQLGSFVMAAGFPSGGSTYSQTVGHIQRFNYVPYAHVSEEGLVIELNLNMKPGNSGGAVISLNQDTYDNYQDMNVLSKNLIGVAFEGRNDQKNDSFVIPLAVLKVFLNQISRILDENPNLLQKLILETYKSNFNVQTMGCELARRKHNISQLIDEKTKGPLGVRVCKHQKFGSENDIRKNDLIVGICGLPVFCDSMTNIRDARIPHDFVYMFSDDHNRLVNFDVIRDNKLCQIPYKCYRNTRLVPRYNYDRPISWAIFGNGVFQALSMPLIEAMSAAKKGFSFEEINLAKNGEKAFKDHECVVMSEVFPTSVNDSMELPTNFIVDEVNGEKVRNVLHFYHLATNPTSPDGVSQIMFADGTEMFVDIAQHQQILQNLFNTNQVPFPGYSFGQSDEYSCRNNPACFNSPTIVSQARLQCFNCKSHLANVNHSEENPIYFSSLNNEPELNKIKNLSMKEDLKFLDLSSVNEDDVALPEKVPVMSNKGKEASVYVQERQNCFY